MMHTRLITSSLAAVLMVASPVAPSGRAFEPAGQGQAAAQSRLPSEAQPSADELSGAIDTLGAFDYDVRMNAARTVRRTEAGQAVAALTRAVAGHPDEYVRYKALVLLAGIGEAAAAAPMRAALTDRNDRMRAVAYAYYEHHPNPEVIPALIEALDSEGSEFVRPALTRAVAAHGPDPRVRDALVPLVMQGADFFRGSVIEALGSYNGTYALAEIRRVARLDGPLQDDAISAVGRLGDADVVPMLAELQKQVPRELQPTVSAALCVIGRDCDEHYAFIDQSLRFAADNPNFQPLLRGAVHAMGMLALRGRDDAMGALITVGVPAAEPARSPIALGVGLVALRDPDVLLRVVESRSDRDRVIALVRDAFDMLSEDYEEERFYVHVRRAYWAAPEGSPRRALVEALIRQLDF